MGANENLKPYLSHREALNHSAALARARNVHLVAVFSDCAARQLYSTLCQDLYNLIISDGIM
jgi:hypothetical protein